MSPLLVPEGLDGSTLILIRGSINAKPPLTCMRSKRDMPAGLHNTVLASRADEEHPAYAVLMALALCPFRVKPPAIAPVEVSNKALLKADIAMVVGTSFVIFLCITNS